MGGLLDGRSAPRLVLAIAACSAAAVALGAVAGSAAALDWQTNNVTSQADGIRDVAAADLDGDADTDLVGAAFDGDRVAWYENDRNESFRTHNLTTDFTWARGVEVADVDGDGDTDVAAAGADGTSWWENTGDGTFEENVVGGFGEGGAALEVVDLDGDGLRDVLVADRGADVVRWQENTGDGNWTAHVLTEQADRVLDVAAADLDGDGDLDALSAWSGSDTLAWHEQGADGNFTTYVIADSLNRTRSVAAADLDADEDLDVVTADRFEDTVSIFTNDGSANFTGRNRTVHGASSVATPDLDGDGRPDLLLGSVFDRVIWFRNQGNATFDRERIASHQERVWSVSHGDVDEDGDLDPVSAAKNADTLAWHDNLHLPPEADFTFSPREPNVGESVQFESTATDPDGTLERWAWTFGDGSAATGPNPEHIYGEPGDGLVTLTVTDSHGKADVARRIVDIDPPPPAPPEDLEATGLPGRVDLTWAASPEGTEPTAFRVSRRPSTCVAGEMTRVAEVENPSYTDLNAALDEPYCYSVEAVNAFGSSGPANVTATPLPVPDPVVADVSVTKNRLRTDLIPSLVNPVAGHEVEVTVANEGDHATEAGGDSTRSGSASVGVVVEACPSEAVHEPVEELKTTLFLDRCEVVAHRHLEFLAVQEAEEVTATWDSTGEVGDHEVVARLAYELPQAADSNDVDRSGTFVVAGGTGAGGLNAPLPGPVG
jgi:hypothetical protein